MECHSYLLTKNTPIKYFYVRATSWDNSSTFDSLYLASRWSPNCISHPLQIQIGFLVLYHHCRLDNDDHHQQRPPKQNTSIQALKDKPGVGLSIFKILATNFFPLYTTINRRQKGKYCDYIYLLFSCLYL
jgi:hypothetical protein